jgi:hypothetical protein
MLEPSILTSTKKILGIHGDADTFDTDVLTHINAAFSVLSQLGIGPTDGFMIEDDTANWEDFLDSDDTRAISLVRTYIFLKVKMLFDPPSTSFLLEATQKQIDEAEWRLRAIQEEGVIQDDTNRRRARCY